MVDFHARQQARGDAGKSLQLLIELVFARVGVFQAGGLVFQQSHDHAKRHKILGRIPEFRIDVQIGELGVKKHSQGKDRGPQNEPARAGDHAGRQAAIPAPEKPCRHKEGQSQRDHEPGIIVVQPRLVDGPRSGKRCERQPKQMLAGPLPDSEYRGCQSAVVQRGQADDVERANVLLEPISDGVSDNRRASHRQKLQGPLVVVNIGRQRSNEHDCRYLKRPQVNGIENRRMALRFERLGDEVNEDQDPGDSPELQPVRASVLAKRDEDPDQNGQDKDRRQLV